MVPSNQLHMMKLLVNQAYEQMGLRVTQLIGTLLDGSARHTPEGHRVHPQGDGRTSAGRSWSAMLRSATAGRRSHRACPQSEADAFSLSSLG
jgi:hypothetical protein